MYHTYIVVNVKKHKPVKIKKIFMKVKNYFLHLINLTHSQTNAFSHSLVYLKEDHWTTTTAHDIQTLQRDL